jgi:hypothetical protein
MMWFAPSGNWTLAGVWVAALGVLGVLARQFVSWRKQANDAEAHLRDALIARVEKLEAKIDRQQVRYEAELSLGNHKFRNVTACFDAMLMMLEMNPDRVPEIVAKIKEMRSSQMIAEAQEKAIIRATSIGPEEDEA